MGIGRRRRENESAEKLEKEGVERNRWMKEKGERREREEGVCVDRYREREKGDRKTVSMETRKEPL